MRVELKASIGKLKEEYKKKIADVRSAMKAARLERRKLKAVKPKKAVSKKAVSKKVVAKVA